VAAASWRVPVPPSLPSVFGFLAHALFDRPDGGARVRAIGNTGGRSVLSASGMVAVLGRLAGESGTGAGTIGFSISKFTRASFIIIIIIYASRRNVIRSGPCVA